MPSATTISEPLRGLPCVTRFQGNPVLSPADIPDSAPPATLVYNAGVAKFNGKYVMAFRNDYHQEIRENPRAESVHIGLATSDDGLHWTVSPEPLVTAEMLAEMGEAGDYGPHMPNIYDPRLTVIEGRCYLCFVTNVFHGLRAGIAVTDDLERFELLDLTTPDNRNLVLFPEKIGGRYFRLERPFPMYGRLVKYGEWRTRFDIWLSRSPDLTHWGGSRLLLGVEDVPFSNDKIGPGAPPVRTSRGWLTVFHAVDYDESRGKNGWEKTWKKRYTAGIMLLDLDDPSRIVGLCKTPLMVPEAEYEVSGGLRNNVLFPGGTILEDNGEVKIYYGAADAVECLATAALDDLLAACLG